MTVGQTVYTVNNKTGKVDSWIYNGMLRTEDELLLNLSNKKGSCFLPARCVFESLEKAERVAKGK